MFKFEIVLEGGLKVIKNGALIAYIHNDMKKRSQIFYICKEAGVEDIKTLLEMLSTQETNGTMQQENNI